MKVNCEYGRSKPAFQEYTYGCNYPLYFIGLKIVLVLERASWSEPWKVFMHLGLKGNSLYSTIQRL